MTDIGELVVRIKADATQLQQELAKATETTKASASEISGALEGVKGTLESFGIALGVGELVEFAKGALEAADNIYIMAQRIGFSGETLSALSIPLQQNGSNIDEFSNSMKFMSRNIETAAQGNQELIQKFDDLGLSVTKLKTLTPEEQFNEIAHALGGVNDQGQLTTDTLALFGRGAAGLIPILKETGGNIQEVIDRQKELGNTLSQEELQKIHEASDAWTAFWGHIKVEAAEATLAVRDFAAAAKEANDADRFNLFGTGPREGLRGTVSTQRPGTIVTDRSDPFGPLSQDQLAAQTKSAKGNNNDILTGDDNDAAEQLQPFIDKLGEEAEAAEQSQKALFIRRTEMEADTKAQNDYTNGLRDTQKLTDDEKAQVDAAAAALYDHKEALAQNKQIADQLSNALGKIVLNFKDMKSAITDLMQSVAQEIIKTQISQPFSNAIQGVLGGNSSSGGLFSGFGKLLGFADGGTPPVGVPSIVGENGPELFVPNQSGTVVPNSKIGGTTVIVQQTIQMSPGLAETVYAAVNQAAPGIASMAHASVFQAIQNGGVESRVVGRRS
jgi:cell fate (sporulation/competence/biofilm development) regulator YmcA (YheA/YmcA/DUF963 family)